MSDVQSAPAPSAGRPTVVTTAGYLMLAVAVLGLILAILPLPYASDVSAAAKHAYANAQNGDQLASAVSVGIYIGLVIDLVGAIGLAILALFNLRGSNITRILTWVLAGLGVLCCGGGTLVGRLASGMTTTTTTNGVDTKQAQKEIAAAYPSWYTGVEITLTLIAVLALILVIILLALPAAHPWFRRRAMVVEEPALPYPPYPSATTEPPAATQPPASPVDERPSDDQ